VGGGFSVYTYADDAAEPANVADGQDTFIGGGDLNWTSVNGTFAGAGGTEDAAITGVSESESYGTSVESADSFAGAGDLNIVTATGSSNGLQLCCSFIGAGGFEFAALSQMGQATANGANQINGGYSFIGAGDLNQISSSGSFIGAGGFMEISGGATGSVNSITAGDSFIGAGDDNSELSSYSFIGAGQQNSDPSQYGEATFIGSGDGNSLYYSGTFIGAGGTLTGGNQADGQDAFVGAGDENIVSSHRNAFIGGGQLNLVHGQYGAIGGGDANVVYASDATAVGGYGNDAHDPSDVIVGGSGNGTSGHDSFAGGYHAEADSGSFVWSDYESGSSVIENTEVGQFVVRASGGTYFHSNEAATRGVELKSGSGTWSNLSDRNAKMDIEPLDDDAILAKVAALPVSIWSYKTESGVVHAGPMAQDFFAAFGVGEDDRHITSIDEDGVTLAAIKALRHEHEGLSARLATLNTRHAALEQRLAVLEARRQGTVGRPARMVQRRRGDATQCSGESGAGSFIGASNGSTGDLGVFSGVVSGVSNQACGSGSGVVAGGSGSGANVADGIDGFIGSGDLNVATGAGTFVGAGGTQSSGNTADGIDSFVGAGEANVTAYKGYGGNGAFIGAGADNQNAGTDGFVGAGYENAVSGSGSFVGAGGALNQTGNTIEVADSFIGAGTSNSITGGSQSFIGTGTSNSISNGMASFIGAGDFNGVTAPGAFIGAGGVLNGGNQNAGRDAFIGAGDQNVIAANSGDAFIGEGRSNTIEKSARYATILDGQQNTVDAAYATVLGGANNTASGSYAVVPGGDGNVAHGVASFACGDDAEAEYDGSFVWGDYNKSSSAVVEDSQANEFVARASAGVYFYSNEDATSGVELPAGGGSWMSLSDRNAKTDTSRLDDQSVLARLAALQVSRWRYRTEPAVRHVGPMAQDFYEAFGVGEDDRHITSIDEAGVALSAIKALRGDEERLQVLANALGAEDAGFEKRLMAMNDARRTPH
jgi:hypothetical protein